MKSQLLSTLETSRKYTLEVADAMPAGQYGFKPVDGVWNFGELMHHIAYGIHWWNENFIRGNETEWAPPVPESDKKKIRAALEKAYDALAAAIGAGEPAPAAAGGFHNTLHHIAHHRGQAVTYLRCVHIEAPEYTY